MGNPHLSAVERMRRAGQSDAAIAAFTRLYELLLAGDTGVLPSDVLEPVPEVPGLDELDEDEAPLDRVVVIKLNGGLGTSMGADGPKSLVPLRGEETFLDVILRQVAGAHPLVLMSSYATRAATLAALADRGAAGAALDLEQSMVPRLRPDDLRPVDWPADPLLEWCPPGHGDLYTALWGSGMLAELRSRGCRWAFVSNADNVGAVVEPRILAWVERESVPFLMEVVDGTEADRKGGHIARRDGRLVLRETAQTPEDDAASFGDFRRWRHYNTNNLWLDLDVLAELLDDARGVLGLPLIVNRKTLDPRAPDSPQVLQLETAMGSALGVVDGARVLRVPRTRFAPVKTTDDLLVARSDAYRLDDAGRIVAAAEPSPFVALDPAFYGRLADFDARFPHGPPSLRRCRRLVVHGDVTFGRGVSVVGDVELDGPRTVPDGATLGA